MSHTLTLADSVAHLSYALKLKDLGVRQDSLWYFVDTRKSWKQRNLPDHSLRFIPFCNLSQDDPECELILGYANALELREGYNESEPLTTFTVAELGEILPTKRYDDDMWKQIWEWEESGLSEANARVKMHIHLIEKGIIKP